MDEERMYFSVFSLFIIKIDNNNYINKIKNKISIEQLKNSDKEDLEIIKKITLKKLYISANKQIVNAYPYLIYPLFTLNENKLIKVDISVNNKLYISFEIKIVNILLNMIRKRGKRNERTSNK